jgi:hypothetical protein
VKLPKNGAKSTGNFGDCATGVQDKHLHVAGGAALLRLPRIQGRAAALPYLEGVDFLLRPRNGFQE